MLYNTAECLNERGGTLTHAHVHTLTLVKSRLCKQAQMNQVVFLVCLLGKLLRSCQSCRLLTVWIKTGGGREREKGAVCSCLCFCWSAVCSCCLLTTAAITAELGAFAAALLETAGGTDVVERRRYAGRTRCSVSTTAAPNAGGETVYSKGIHAPSHTQTQH